MAAPRKYELSPKRRDAAAQARLRRLVQRSLKTNELKTWARARVVLAFVEGREVTAVANELAIDRSTASRWIAAYAQRGFPSLQPTKPAGRVPRLSADQLKELTAVIERGPREAGFESSIWTGRTIADLIRSRFDVRYSWKYIPQLLHRLGFSVQRPRKLLAKADHEAQAQWLRARFPTLKKKLDA